MTVTANLVLLLSLALAGNCQEECGGLWSPVCGTDGLTYSNLCALELADTVSGDVIDVGHMGPCEQGCDLDCFEGWFPVCGSDGLTYSSSCTLAMANCLSPNKTIEAEDGECQPPVQNEVPSCPLELQTVNCSPAIYSPVCELSTATTYPSTCHLCQAQFEAQIGGENIIYIIDHLGPC